MFDHTPADRRAVWLLDVDGVINAKRPGWHEMPRHATVTADRAEYRITWSPQLVRQIRAIHESGAVRIRWCTTWCPWVWHLEKCLGLPGFDRVWDLPLFGEDARRAKLDAAIGVVRSGRRLVWTDDDAIPPPGHPAGRMRLDRHALLIEPDRRRGLLSTDIDAIWRFLTVPQPSTDTTRQAVTR